MRKLNHVAFVTDLQPLELDPHDTAVSGLSAWIERTPADGLSGEVDEAARAGEHLATVVLIGRSSGRPSVVREMDSNSNGGS